MIIKKVIHSLKSKVRYLADRINFQGLKCRLTHKIVNHGVYFTDMVNGKAVNLYTCNKCHTSYMAHSKRALFRVYIINPTPKSKPKKRKHATNKINKITKEGYRP